MDNIEKQERLTQTIHLKFQPFLTCSTQDCLNPATVGVAAYDQAARAWQLTPICKACVLKQMKTYGIQPED